MKLAGLGTLVMPIAVLAITAVAVSLHAGTGGARRTPGRTGSPRSSMPSPRRATTTGRPSAGLTGDTTFYNVLGGIDMLIGRFGIMIPALALGGVLAAKNTVPAGAGTFRTDNPMFVGLLIGVILIIGGLTFFPAVSLGPIVEQFSHGKFF